LVLVLQLLLELLEVQDFLEVQLLLELLEVQ
jgi:hypothetical protein